MNIELIIKILAITMVTTCCTIATFTDVKKQIIPNKLTLTSILVGLTLSTIYYYLTGIFNVFYYVSVIIVFLFSYLLWKLGVWAGGDVKLFTAIATLLNYDFIDILPRYTFFTINFPVNFLSFKIPTFIVVFNSLISVLPLIVIYISYVIIKEKPYLIGRLRESIHFNQVLLSLNSLIISYQIIHYLNIDFMALKWITLISLSLLLSRLIKNKYSLMVISVLIIFYHFFTSNILLYLLQFLLMLILVTLIKIFKNGIIKEALTSYMPVKDLKDGMILSKSLYQNDEKYFFKSYISLLNNENRGNLIIESSVSGLTNPDIQLIKNLNLKEVPIKKSLSFAPFILSGLILTLFFGNTITLLMELI